MAETPHAIVFPFMAQGHTLPLLDLANILCHRGVKVTVFTTPSNSGSVLRTLSRTPNVGVQILDFPPSGEAGSLAAATEHLPSMDDFVSFFYSAKRLRQPFERSLEKMTADSGEAPPVCIISDSFLPWTVESASRFNIPRLAFFSFSAYSISVTKSLYACRQYDLNQPSPVPGLPTKVIVCESEVMQHMRRWEGSDPFTELTVEVVDGEMRSHGVVFNTFTELEPIYSSHVQTYFKSPVWCVGPLAVPEEGGRRGGVKPHVWKTCCDWLDGHAAVPDSVLYASFGTLARVSDEQMTEIAAGLEASGCNFLLVVRSETWLAMEGFEERVSGRGLVLREWTPQPTVLEHHAVGGFLTHCGWNSVMESLTAGVPMLTWPLESEQPLNEKMVVEELGAGIRVRPSAARLPTAPVSRDVVRERVVELMTGEKGRAARKRAEEIGRAARNAVKEGGSSHTALGSLIDSLCRQQAPGTSRSQRAGPLERRADSKERRNTTIVFLMLVSNFDLGNVKVGITRLRNL